MKFKEIVEQTISSAQPGNMIKVIDPSRLRGNAEAAAVEISINGAISNQFLVHKITPKYVIVSRIGSFAGAMDEDDKFRVGHDNVKVIRKSPKYGKPQRGGSHRMSGGGMR